MRQAYDGIEKQLTAKQVYHLFTKEYGGRVLHTAASELLCLEYLVEHLLEHLVEHPAFSFSKRHARHVIDRLLMRFPYLLPDHFQALSPERPQARCLLQARLLLQAHLQLQVLQL